MDKKKCAFKNAKRVFSLIYGFTNLLLACRLEHQTGVGAAKLKFALKARQLRPLCRMENPRLQIYRSSWILLTAA